LLSCGVVNIAKDYGEKEQTKRCNDLFIHNFDLVYFH